MSLIMPPDYGIKDIGNDIEDLKTNPGTIMMPILFASQAYRLKYKVYNLLEI